MRRKKFQKVKERDGQVREITEDEVLFKKTDEDLMLIATTYTALTQASLHNISILNEQLTKAKSMNKTFEEENINLKAKGNNK